MNAWCFTVWRANITRNVLGKSSKHLDCGSIAGVVLLVCLFMHSPLWRHDVGFLSQTSLFVTETFHAEWQSRSQGFSSYVATTPRQQLSPQMSNVFFSFSFVRKTTWSSAHFNHISIIFTCDWSKVYFSTVLFWTSYWFFLLFRRKINCYRNSPSRAINYFCIGSILEHTKRTVGRQLYTTTQRIFLAQSGSSINIAVWKWLCKTLSLSGLLRHVLPSYSAPLFSSSFWPYFSRLHCQMSRLQIYLKKKMLLVFFSPSSCPRTLTTTRLDHPCVSTSLTRDQTKSRSRLQTNQKKINKAFIHGC